MNFKDLKPDYILYVFDRKNITYKEAKAISVSLPRFESKIGQQPGTVVDVSVEIDDKTITYVFHEDTAKSYNGDIMFATSKSDVIEDIKAIKKASEQSMADYNKHQDIVSKCDDLLGELDTEIKEKQKLDSRLDSIESMMTAILSKLNIEVSQ